MIGVWILQISSKNQPSSKINQMHFTDSFTWHICIKFGLCKVDCKDCVWSATGIIHVCWSSCSKNKENWHKNNSSKYFTTISCYSRQFQTELFIPNTKKLKRKLHFNYIIFLINKHFHRYVSCSHHQCK